MPELPEVESIRRKLEKLLLNKQVAQVEVRSAKSFLGEVEQVQGMAIEQVQRRAKVIQLGLSNGLQLLVHLKMTGQLIYVDDTVKIGGGHPTADWVNDLPGAHTRVIIEFSDQSKLFFNDQRKFGWLKLATRAEVAEFFARFGPDANTPEFTVENFAAQLQRRRVPIKQLLMDNQVVAGVGNIYATEALFLSKISPLRSANSLNEAEIVELVNRVKQVITRGIELGGTTFDGKYVGVDGLAGGYQHELLVYGQEGKKCQICGQEMIKIKLGGRGTTYCPNCQR